MTLSINILIGLALGIVCGLFVGEYAANLNWIGEAFIGLLQMTVLPYIVVSLVANIGRLSTEQARRLLRIGGTLLAIFLVIGTIALAIIPFSFPKLGTSAFFSRSLIEPRKSIDVLDLYIPTNPFNSLSTGTVPAIVVFSIFIGIGLIPVKNKAEVISGLDIVTDALVVINKIAVKLTPIGVFAIAADAAGTMTLREIGRLEAYLLSYSVAVALLTFLVLPAMVAIATPFRFGDVFRVFGGTMLLIFVTGKLIVVMPQLIESVKSLFRNRTGSEEIDRDSEILVPLIYPFPNIGTFVIFVFLPFTAWFVGRPLGGADYPVFLGVTLLVSFVSPVVGIPFLLDLMRLPSDVFHLFIVSSVYTDRIRVVLGGMHIFVFAVLAGSALHGMIRIRWRAGIVYATTILMVVVTCVLGVRGILSLSLKHANQSRILAQMSLLGPAVRVSTLAAAAPNPVARDEGERLLDRIHRRGVLRFAYDPHRAPFCFINSSGDVVGFDIELMHQLAQTLGVGLELVPTTRQTIGSQAAGDYYDLAGCGFLLTSTRSATLQLSGPYLDLHAAFVVPNDRRHDLDSIAQLAGRTPPVIGVATDQGFATFVESAIPQARIVRFDEPEEFFRDRNQEMLALFTSAESGSAMTLIHPSYSVVIPTDLKILMPSVFVISGSDDATRRFLDDWILLRQKNGVLDRLYDYWILGKTAERRGPRWSIIQNVFGWVR